jgi:hypothetical protein
MSDKKIRILAALEMVLILPSLVAMGIPNYLPPVSNLYMYGVNIAALIGAAALLWVAWKKYTWQFFLMANGLLLLINVINNFALFPMMVDVGAVALAWIWARKMKM